MICLAKQTAIAQGLSRYSTGKPCKRGHVCERVTKTSVCVECSKLWDDQKRAKNPEKYAAMSKAWRQNNRERYNEIQGVWAKAHPEYNRLRAREWNAKNPGRSVASSTKYFDKNPHIRAANEAKRRASQRGQTPAWANSEAIKAFYRKAREITKLTGVLHHVDHIIPLQGKAVSGLHVEANLQILPGKINQSKGNQLLAA